MGGEAVSLCSPTVGEAPTPLGAHWAGPGPTPNPIPPTEQVTGSQGLLNWKAMDAVPPTSNITKEAKSI